MCPSADHLQAARCPTAGGRCNAFTGHFMVPPTATIVRIATLQKRPPGGRSGARAAACKHALIPRGWHMVQRVAHHD